MHLDFRAVKILINKKEIDPIQTKGKYLKKLIKKKKYSLWATLNETLDPSIYKNDIPFFIWDYIEANWDRK